MKELNQNDKANFEKEKQEIIILMEKEIQKELNKNS
jgi:hypothetical protein